MPQKGQTAARGSLTLRIVSVLSQCFESSQSSNSSTSVPTTEAWQMNTWVIWIRSVMGQQTCLLCGTNFLIVKLSNLNLGFLDHIPPFDHYCWCVWFAIIKCLTLLSVLSVSLIWSKENGFPSSVFPVVIVVLDESGTTWVKSCIEFYQSFFLPEHLSPSFQREAVPQVQSSHCPPSGRDSSVKPRN